jgi:hypothetical protein
MKTKPKTKTTAARKFSPPKRTPAKGKAPAKPAARKKVTAKGSASRKKPKSILQTVKRTVQKGMKKVGDAVKNITPGALVAKSVKARRRR